MKTCHITGKICTCTVPALCAPPPAVLDNVAYLRNLAERLRHIPVMYGTDDYDISRLYRLAKELEK